MAPVTLSAEILTLERAFASPDLSGSVPRSVAFSPDGKRVTYLKARIDNVTLQDLWAVEVSGGEPYRLVDASGLSSGERQLSEAEKARRERARGIVEYGWDAQDRLILVPLDGDLHLYSVSERKTTRLTQRRYSGRCRLLQLLPSPPTKAGLPQPPDLPLLARHCGRCALSTRSLWSRRLCRS